MGLFLGPGRPLGGAIGRQSGQKWPKMAKNNQKDLLETKVTLEAPNWLIKNDQGLIWPGHIWGNVFGPFPGSRKASGGCHRPPMWPKIAKNDLLEP